MEIESASMPDNIANWLEKLGLGKYADVFAENAINIDVLPHLSEEDLKELGLPLGHRRKLQAAIRTLADSNGPMAPPVMADASPSSEAERRQLTVMFCDLAGSTELSQKLDLEDLREVNRAYQDACKAAIDRYDGYVARYMGDGVLAYFGYPQAHEDDAERAIHAGLRVVEAMTDLNQTFGDRQDIKLAVRVGVATGPVVVGDLIGEGASVESAVIGETPNLAARLQALAVPNSVVISPNTHVLTVGRFEFEDLGTQELKGIAKPVQAWRVAAPATVESRFEAAHRAGFTPLVGREHEIGLLLDRWEQAKDGDGQVILLSGQAGIGKSRITDILRERTTTDNPIWLRYQCSPYHTNSALHPVIEQLERAAQLDDKDPPQAKLDKLESLLAQAASDVEVVAPLFASLLSIPSEDRYASLEMAPEQQKEATLHALVSQFGGLSRRRPVLLIFEDAHWADPTSVELLELTIERAQDLSVLVIITFRPEFTPPWTGHTHVTPVGLNRLSRALVTALIEGVTGGIQLPDDVRDQIIEKTDGVPLFVEELTKSILESGLLEDKDGHYAFTSPLPSLAIPTTLHDSLMARLDRSAQVKEVAQTAAVIGREFTEDLLAAVSPLSEDELRLALQQLLDSMLIFRRGTAPTGRYSFKHALVRDAAYQGLLKSKRKTLHAVIAETLEKQFAGRVSADPELLAHHYTEADLHASALTYWLEAGRQAIEHGAYVEAISHLQRGLGLTERLSEESERVRSEIKLRVVLGVALIGEGAASPMVAENYQRARALCAERGETSELFPVLWGLWFHHMWRSDFRAAAELADELVSLGSGEADTGLRLTAHHCQWTSRFLIGDFAEAIEHAHEGMSLYRAEEHHALTFTYGVHDPGVCARNISGLALALTGHPKQAAERFDTALELAGRLRHKGTLADVLSSVMLFATILQDRELMQDKVEALDKISSAERLADYWLEVELARNWELIEQGDAKFVRQRLPELAQSFLDRGISWTGPWISFCAIHIGRHGEVNVGLQIVDEALELGERGGVHCWAAEFWTTKGSLLLMGAPSDYDGAASCMKKGIQIARAQGAKLLELRATTRLAQLRQSQGKHDEAHELLAPVYDWFTEGFDTPDLKEAKALLEQLSDQSVSAP